MSTATQIRCLLFLLSVLALSVHAQYGEYGGNGGIARPSTTLTRSPLATISAWRAGASGEAGEYGSNVVVSSHSATVAHVVCGALATMFFLPAGVLLARSRMPFWFPVHAVWQFLLSLGFVCAAFGIAWAHFSGGLDSPHRRAATALFTLVIAQALLGVCAHFLGRRMTHLKTRTGRSALHFFHWFLGFVVIGLGWAVAYLGLSSEWEKRGHGHVSGGWKAGWGVVLGIWITLYVIGLGFLPLQIRKERERVASRVHGPEMAETGETAAMVGPAPEPGYPKMSYETRSSF